MGNNDFLDHYLEQQSYHADSSNILYRIPVKFWVYRLTNGKGGVEPAYLKQQIQYLNYYYSKNNTGFRFYLYPEISYIDNDRLYVLKYFTSAVFQNFAHKKKGCANILIVGNLIKRRIGSVPKEYNGTHNSVTHNIIIRQNIDTQTLSHEVGHFFGLEHPHRNWNKGKRRAEAVDRNRRHPSLFKSKRICEYNGDKLCDTPAEPNLTAHTDNKCRYTGWNVKDPWGDVYKPHTNNIMSYTRNRECRTAFTKGQIAVMRYTADKYRYSEGWINTGKNKKYSFDYQEPNDCKETASRVLFNTKQRNTFHKVFNNSGKNEPTDLYDWFFFEINSSQRQSISISTEKTDIKFPVAMKVELYKGNSTIEPNNNGIVKRNALEYNGLKKGKYYIKISNTQPEDKLTGYILEVSSNASVEIP
ncbi:MAG: M43 family zinc metalloprotease [Bacteroidota bacterium]|nr:M43 family zinc metalloprotease [Bacteroidota bacterium]